jgi:DNA modification methylase
MDYVVDVRVSSRELTEQERKKLVIYLRKGAVGHFDFDILANNWELDELLEWGFDKKELDLDLWAGDAPEDAGAQIDKAEELREKWGVESGQLWQLGEHRLICGDCTDRAVVERVMGGERADMVFTDPPYNVASNSRNFAADKSKAMDDLKNAEWDKDFDITTVFPLLETVMAKDCAVYICTSQWLVQIVWEWMWSWSDFCFYCVFCKPNPMPSLAKRHWTWATELIPYAVRGKHIANFPREGHALNWWNIPKEKDTNHPTEKPLEVPERAIGFSSNQGQIVFDGFLGSGTTLIACERLGRKCRAVEISPAYVSVALQRFYDTTGVMPVLIEED